MKVRVQVSASEVRAYREERAKLEKERKHGDEVEPEAIRHLKEIAFGPQCREAFAQHQKNAAQGTALLTDGERDTGLSVDLHAGQVVA